MKKKYSFTYEIIVIIYSITIFISSSEVLSEWEIVNSASSYVPNKIYSLDNIIFISSDSGLYKSNNSGENWNKVTFIKTILNFASIGSTLFVITDSSIYKTSNYGDNWTQMAPILQNYLPGFSDFCINPPYFYLNRARDTTFYPRSLFYTSDQGNTWFNKNIPNNINSGNILGTGSNIYVISTNKVYKSTNFGDSWFFTYQLPVPANTVYSQKLIQSNNCYYGANDTLLMMSTDQGNTWNNIASNLPMPFNSLMRDLKYYNNCLIVGKMDGIYLTSNDGQTWINKTDNLPYLPYVSSIVMNQYYIFLRIAGAKIYRRNLSEVIGIQFISTEIPASFSLSQNFPNPFNPITNIKFDIVAKNIVKLSVFDILGREVSILVNQLLSAGSYKIDWNATNYPSGVYFYKLTTGDFVETRKMVLIK